MDTTLSHESSINSLSSAARARLDEAKIFFGHQSVGGNIVDGLKSLVASDPQLKLSVVDGAETNDMSSFFAHARIGKNGNPQAKTDAFSAAMDAGLGERVDVAFHKYCYADISAGSNVQRMFDHYRQSMQRLRERYPGVTFVHVTTPLMQVQSGPKAVIKKLLHRMPDHYADNMKREQFNDLLRREYERSEPIFDLAAIESTRPGGERESISFDGATSYALVPDYTTDGGHLNDPAKRMVAQQLLVFLARTLEGQPAR
jgi:hypothetical protein